MPIRNVASEIKFLVDNPQFVERPATVAEFLGSEYLNLDDTIRPSIRKTLIEIMGDDVDPAKPTQYPLSIFTGSIGSGKSTLASIILTYLVHWCLCLENPQKFFDLMPGTRIAFMMMSTSERQAKDVIFGDVKARIDNSPWFKDHPRDPKLKSQYRFEKDIWIIPGDSSERTFEGYNILGGIMDEIDSHDTTKDKDYAEVGYSTIANRISSRFGDRGFLILVGQMKMSQGFAARKYNEFMERDDAHTTRMTIWESRGKDFYKNLDPDGEYKTFRYDIQRKMVVPDRVATSIESEQIIEIPTLYLNEFRANPEKALRDLAGIPPAVGDPFISLTHKIEACASRWVDRYGLKSFIDADDRINPGFRATDSIKRVMHVDIAYSSEGDALGMAMGHVREVRLVDDEWKPHIVIDMVRQVVAPAGQEIFLGDVRQFIYMLRDEYNYKIDLVTFDGFNSTDFRQQLERKHIPTDYVSVDKDRLPYFDLKDAIYEDRIDIPDYEVKPRGMREETGDLIKICDQELRELSDDGRKVDHPSKGSKDCADALAGVVFTLMGDRRYSRRVTSWPKPSMRPSIDDSGYGHPAYTGDQVHHTAANPLSL